MVLNYTLEEWQKKMINHKFEPCPKCGSNMIPQFRLHRNTRVVQCSVCKWFKLYPLYPQQVVNLEKEQKTKGFKPIIKIIDEKERIKEYLGECVDEDNTN